MLPTPTKYTLVAGAGEGQTPLNAFDRALLESGAGNVNLIRVSSILPPGARYVETLPLPPGALVPVAYGAIKSSTPGDRIAAAVAVGIPEQGFGVIMEYSGYNYREEAERIIRQMVEEAFAMRGMEIKTYMVKAVEHRVQKAGAAFAGLLMWY
ncbi:arginine decarboxylase, pyruvoyl-dependent [Desulfofundulus thermobenzoicus]|uniref:Pyruvoyl-dependent arginine decarboxylase AaxB n=1 Tax=Desulfofundulus thermobenzoicus TaxID=29376 RepID=A0A6N7IML7_9FIRM|nr:arginine decarboxylase, pyruvoyl-dependent [Desulfofundulus thermobenzoicus]MQL51225.1 arginine decarboxylase, pyruvoyl-dependent [Desulfofundulus thermobenzoicus]